MQKNITQTITNTNINKLLEDKEETRINNEVSKYIKNIQDVRAKYDDKPDYSQKNTFKMS